MAVTMVVVRRGSCWSSAQGCLEHICPTDRQQRWNIQTSTILRINGQPEELTIDTRSNPLWDPVNPSTDQVGVLVRHTNRRFLLGAQAAICSSPQTLSECGVLAALHCDRQPEPSAIMGWLRLDVGFKILPACDSIANRPSRQAAKLRSSVQSAAR
ncbi:uncharacterized protein BCR38DRAFT_93894 [Pseudomassariella vexata]|uniref:Uncharacterized protein n=1 Tax=Pseudomassariella vexata TaxID=1141098 RepID=A0A1Y2EE36_9PEZI|nr:uncharacterized protein BCR38DRAFT_93894 [Pseudomassariella vexata]ORY69838.1 hypothetical protein BCR38DRAFT_93894 [Pseudomassariella vexata]